MLQHGIEVGVGDVPTHFRYGILRLLHDLSDRSIDTKPWSAVFRRRLRSRRFSNGVQHFQGCLHKFNRAAEHVQRCRSDIARWVERGERGECDGVSMDDPEFQADYAAHQDLPLHLDSMLLYQRLMADTLSILTTHLYEPHEIAAESFRDQKKWFTKKCPEFDAGYAEILNSNFAWFEKLAGTEPRGLRDVVVHHRGHFQVGWTALPGGKLVSLNVGLVNEGGFVEGDMMSALPEINAGWCSFLDAAWQHHVERLREILPWYDTERSTRSRYMGLGGFEPGWTWTYKRERSGE